MKISKHNFVGCRVLRSKVLETVFHPASGLLTCAMQMVGCTCMCIHVCIYMYVSQLPYSCEQEPISATS